MRTVITTLAIVVLAILVLFLIRFADTDTKDTFQDCETCPVMTVIPAGEFVMGNLHDEPGNNEGRPPWQSVDDEFPLRTVTIAAPFALGQTPVTVDQFRTFVDATGYSVESGCASFTSEGLIPNEAASWAGPPFEQSGNHAVTCLSWNDAMAYTAWLAELTGEPYRLPSEAEWEYAARAGAETPHPNGDSITYEEANFGAGPTGGVIESTDQWEFTSPVGSFAPNPFGLYDIQGNVFEWIADCYSPNYEAASADGSPWTGDGCQYAMLRGGSWSSTPFVLRLSNRDANQRTARLDQYGLRVARDLP